MENHTKYINPFVDFAFKRIFGTEPNKDLLMGFLNAIFNGRKTIVDLMYSKTEYLGDNTEEAKTLFDLLCTGENGEKFLIEVQHSSPVNFKKNANGTMPLYSLRLKKPAKLGAKPEVSQREGWRRSLN